MYIYTRANETQKKASISRYLFSRSLGLLVLVVHPDVYERIHGLREQRQDYDPDAPLAPDVGPAGRVVQVAPDEDGVGGEAA